MKDKEKHAVSSPVWHLATLTANTAGDYKLFAVQTD